MSTILKKELKKTNSSKNKLSDKHNVEEPKKKMTWCEEYRCMATGNMKLASNLMVEKLGKELKEWARTNEDAIRICEFFAEKGINLFTYQNWVKKDEEFRDNYYHAMRYIGRRREKLGIYRKYNCNEGMIRTTMHHFMDEFKNDIEWHASLRNKEDDKGGTKYIVIESVPATNVVKEKTND